MSIFASLIRRKKLIAAEPPNPLAEQAEAALKIFNTEYSRIREVYPVDRELTNASFNFRFRDLHVIDSARNGLEYLITAARAGSGTPERVSFELYKALVHLGKLEIIMQSLGGYVDSEAPRVIRTSLIEMLRKSNDLGCVSMTSFRSEKSPDDEDRKRMMPLTTRVSTPEEMNECGTTACLSGHMRLNKEVNRYLRLDLNETAANVVVTGEGGAHILGTTISAALILGVPAWFASLLIFDSLATLRQGGMLRVHRLYRKPFREVTGNDVADILQQLVDGKSPDEIYEEAQRK